MTAKTFALIAWRNVRRNGRRSFLTVLIASIGLATLIISNALYDGFHEKMVENAVRIFMGHIQVHSSGFHRNPAVDKFFYLPREEMVRDLPYIRASAERVRFQALASTAEVSHAVNVVGVEPELERQVTVLKNSVLEGEYFSDTEDTVRECLVGEHLFANLRMELGERLIIMSQSFDGVLAADAFRVTGICRTGNPDIDRSFVWIPITAAQGMLNYGKNFSEIVLLLENAERVEYIKSRVSERVASSSGQSLEVLDWKEIAPDIVQLIALDRAMQSILMAIIAVIVSVAVMNAMLISIQERYAEFGILASIGTRPAQIVSMIMWESFFLGLLGIAGGIVVTGLGFIYFYSHGVNLASFSEGVSRFIGLDTTVFPLLKAGQVFFSSMIILLSSTIISIFPALKAARMDTIKAIRHI